MEEPKSRPVDADKIIHKGIEPIQNEELNKDQLYKTRNNIQISRRLFHMGMGVTAATVYNLFLEHQQAVYILGTCACIMYIFEQAAKSSPVAPTTAMSPFTATAPPKLS